MTSGLCALRAGEWIPLRPGKTGLRGDGTKRYVPKAMKTDCGERKPMRKAERC